MCMLLFAVDLTVGIVGLSLEQPALGLEILVLFILLNVGLLTFHLCYEETHLTQSCNYVSVCRVMSGSLL